MRKELWVCAYKPDSKEERKRLAVSALENGASGAIVRSGDEGFSSLGKMDLLFFDDGRLNGERTGLIVELKDPRDQDAILELKDTVDIVVLSESDWKIIPLENMIARFRNSRTKVFASVTDADQAGLFLKTLEIGVDGIVTDDASLVKDILGLMESSDSLHLDALTVTGITEIGLGDRVCVDSCSMMTQGEGMLVGSQSSCLFLIQSESDNSGYVEARPFRVNAGAVHSYIRVPGGNTRYLSELKGGDSVLIVDKDGGTSPASVGRCKIEKRPLLMIEADSCGRRFTVMLQNAETVRMVGPDGSVSVANLKVGDTILASIESGGRHFGMSIDETIREM